MSILCYNFVDLNNKVLNTSIIASKLYEGWMLDMDGNKICRMAHNTLEVSTRVHVEISLF